MTLLSMCQQVANEIGLPQLNQIVNSTDETARRLLAAAQRAGKVLASGKIYDISGKLIGVHSWGALRKQGTIILADSTESYSIESDLNIAGFKRMLADTVFDKTNDNRVYYINAEEWNAIDSSYADGFTINWYLYRRGDSLLVKPVPASTDAGTEIVFEYITDAFCESSSGADQTAWLADSDVGILSEELMELGIRYRYLMSVGAPYAEEYREYIEQVQIAVGEDKGMQTLYLGQHQYDDYVDHPNIPRTNIGV